jgi:hypothetical protein
MATKESIEAAIAGLPADDFWHLLLTHLKDNPSQSVPMEGPVYEAYQKQIGGKFGSVRSYRTAVGTKCKAKYGSPCSEIQALFKVQEGGGGDGRRVGVAYAYPFDPTGKEPQASDPSNYDPEYYAILSKTTLYATYKKNDDAPYMFIPIYYPDYNVYQFYYTSRYVGNLPYYTTLNDFKLATVDHTTLNHRDERHTNLRYVTPCQNLANSFHMGKNTEVRYHGLRDQDAYVNVNVGKHENKKTLNKIQVWCRVLDHYLHKRPNASVTRPALVHISTTECSPRALKHLEEWERYAGLMDKFVGEMFAYLEDSSDTTEYNVQSMSGLPEVDESRYPLLFRIAKKCPETLCSTVQFYHHFVAALVYDINKRYTYQEFAQGNFLKPIRNVSTTFAAPKSPVKTPAEVLNDFEEELTDDYLNNQYEQLGIPVRNKVREYYMEDVNGRPELRARFRERKGDYQSKLIDLGVDTSSLRITNPDMVFKT